MSIKRNELILEPISKRVQVSEDMTILDAIQQLNIQVNANCSGKGTCGSCKLRIVKGKVSEITDLEKKVLKQEDIDAGIRLACQTTLLGDCKVYLDEIFLQHMPNILTTGAQENYPEYEIQPQYWKVKLNLKKYPILSKSLSDYDLVLHAIRENLPILKAYRKNNYIETHYECLRKISTVIRENDGILTATIQTNISSVNDPLMLLDVEAGDTSRDLYGIAFDLGTTTMVGYLINLTNGELVSVESLINPQTSIGEDIISRMDYASQSQENFDHIRKILYDGFEKMIANSTMKLKIKRNFITEIVLVGNTAMHHIFYGFNVKYLGRAPFSPVYKDFLRFRNYHLNLPILSPNVDIYSPPIISGFVGADTIACVIAIRMDKVKKTTLLIDIGTNGEIVLNLGGTKMFATSVAAGSGFEGAHIKNGMRGTEGAIELIKINPDTLEAEIGVIGNTQPLGLCGSAIIDVVAEMLRTKIITRSGKFNNNYFSNNPHSRVRKTEDGWEYVIHSPEQPAVWAGYNKNVDADKEKVQSDREIVFTQDDVREIQKGKGAFLSAILLLLKKAEIDFSKIEKVCLAGAFGTYIHKENAQFIGMFPDVDSSKVFQIGNAAGEGAKALLLNVELRDLASKIAKEINFLETANDESFEHTFAESMYFPHMKFDYFPKLKEEYKDIPLR